MSVMTYVKSIELLETLARLIYYNNPEKRLW